MPPPPQQPQNPYGQQPPQGPGPYGPPPGPQPQPPYGAQPYNPQQPYPPQQPFPPQQPYPAWGMPPMGPPPKKSRVGLVLGIVGGVVVLIVGGLVALGVLGWQIEKSLPKAENKLTLPGTLVDGQYEFAEKMPASQTGKIEDEANSAWDAKDIHALGARYDRGGDPSKGLLVVSGMYGRFKHEADVRHGMLKGAADADGVTLVQPEKDATPPGAQTTITCEVVSQQESLVTVTYPICAWADGNTAAVVGEIDVEHKDASDVDIAAAARDTLAVRSEMIKPAN